MKKRAHGYSRWRWRSGGYLLLGVALVIIVLMKLQEVVLRDTLEYPEPTFSETLQITNNNSTKPKLAFMFLARRNMPLDILWDHFFEGSREAEYSVYIHARPGYSYTKDNTDCRAFINRQLQNPIQVVWGEASMIQAERLLLTAALQDPLNERFFLLSDSCIPLYNFNYVYTYVMASQKSFVDSFVDYADEQYNILMGSVIPQEKWRKGSQWFVIIRKHAEAVVADSTVFPVFVDYCKKVVLPDNWDENTVTNKTKKQHNCIPDEHYIQTLLAIEDLEDEIERRTLTYSRWENSVKGKGRQGWHPVTFSFADASLKAITDVQDITNVRYETESRTEWCSSSGQARRCFLFARKFTKAAAFRLYDQVASYEYRS